MNPSASSPPTVPHRDEIAQLEPFIGLGLESICVVEDKVQADQAFDEMTREKSLGFDTESRPTFRKNQVSDGPHILQFSTENKAWIFHSHCQESLPAVIKLLESNALLKIGFGLKDDLKYITRKFGVDPQGIIDLNHSFHRLGHKNTIGAKTAIALFFNQKLQKSKKVTTSDWSRPTLSEKQILYAANDAYAALLVYLELERQSSASRL